MNTALQTLGLRIGTECLLFRALMPKLTFPGDILTLSHAETRSPGRLPPKQENQTLQDKKDLQENGRNCILHTLHTFLVSV